MYSARVLVLLCVGVIQVTVLTHLGALAQKVCLAALLRILGWSQLR